MSDLGGFGGGGGWGGPGGGMGRRRARQDDSQQPEKINWELVGNVIKMAMPLRKWITIFAATSIVYSMIGAAPPLLFKQVVDVAIPNKDLRLLTQLSLGAIGLVLFRSLLALGQRWSSDKLGVVLVYDLRTRGRDDVQRMPPPFFIRSQTGAVLSRINNDVSGGQAVLTDIISTLTSNVVQPATVITVMVVLEWRLSMLVLVVVPSFLIITKKWGKIAQRLTRDRLDASAAMNSLSTEKLNASGIQLVHLYGDFDREIGEFAEKAGEVRRLSIRTSLVTGVSMLLMGLVTRISTALVYGYGGWLSHQGAITRGPVHLLVP